MRNTITILEEGGMPVIRVPRDDVWDLIEYLAAVRTRVTYTFEGADVLIAFNRLDRAGVQRLVDEWGGAAPVGEPAHRLPPVDSWVVGRSH